MQTNILQHKINFFYVNLRLSLCIELVIFCPECSGVAPPVASEPLSIILCVKRAGNVVIVNTWHFEMDAIIDNKLVINLFEFLFWFLKLG